MAQKTFLPTPGGHVERGIRLYKQRNYGEAITAYQSAINMKPDCAEAYANLGNLFFERGEYQAALCHYFDAIKIAPTAIDYDKWVRALDHVSDEKQQEIIDGLAKFAGTDRRYAVAYENWAQALIKRKRNAQADEKFRKAHELDAQNGSINKGLADSLYDREEYENAMERYLATLRINPGLVDFSRWQKTLDHLSRELRSKAEEEFHRVALEKVLTDSLYNKWAWALVELERFEAAYEKYRRALEISVQDASVYKSLGDAFFREGRYEKALDQYLEAIRIKPTAVYCTSDPDKSDPGAVDYALWVEALHNVSQEKQDLINEGLQRVPLQEKSAVYRQWGDALFALGSYNEASQQYKQAALNESDFEAYNNWGLALAKLNRWKEATEKYNHATKSSAVSAAAYVNWGNLCFLQKAYLAAVEKYLAAMAINHDLVNYDGWVKALALCGVDERERIARKVWKLSTGKPGFATLYFKWGRALADFDNHKGALNKYRNAAELDPGSSATHLGWGDALAKQEDWWEATGVYLKALQLCVEQVPLPELTNLLREVFPKLIGILDHLDAGEQERVVKKIETIAADSSNGAEVYHQWGYALSGMGRGDAAVEKYERALKLDNEYAKSIYNCGVILEEQRRYQEAQQKYQEAIAIEPEDYTNYNAWGNALLGLKNCEGAIEKYQTAIRLEKNVSSYIWCGVALSRAKDYEGAFEKFEQGTEIEPKSATIYFGWGNVLAEVGRYDEAYEKFRKAIEVNPDEVDATYAAHNIGEYLFRQGKYGEGRRAWKDARLAYQRTRQKAAKSRDKEYFQYYGNMVRTIFGELDEAEKIYLEGLELDPKSVVILTALTGLLIEKKDASPPKSNDNIMYWKAREYFQRAYNILKSQAITQTDSVIHQQFGELLLALGDYMTHAEKKEAEQQLLKGLGKDRTSADILTNLGVLYAREKNFKKAIQYFSDALNLDPRNLNIWSNLAEAYLKAALKEQADPGLKEMAEKEFKQILEITPNHVESIIGLGEVYKAMGDLAKDEDLYLRAIELFLQGIRIADSDVGSKKLKRKELAAAYYSIGYSKVKLCEAAKPGKGNALLHEARDYFTLSLNDDPENYKAKRAVEKLDKRLTLSASRLVDLGGPWVIVLAAIAIFFVTQRSVIKSQPPFKDLEAGYYALLSFGSLLFAIAGICLPQLLKLKVAGIELEKNAVDQIATAGGLGISK